MREQPSTITDVHFLSRPNELIVSGQFLMGDLNEVGFLYAMDAKLSATENVGSYSILNREALQGGSRMWSLMGQAARTKGILDDLGPEERVVVRFETTLRRMAGL